MKLRLAKSYLLVVALVILIVVFLGLVLLPYQKKTQSEISAINEKRIDLFWLSEQTKKSGQSNSETELTKTYELLDKYLLKKTEILNFIAELEELGQTHHLTIAINLNEFVESTAPVLEQPISLELTGTYADAISFLQALDAQDYYLNFSAITVGQASASVTGREPEKGTTSQGSIRVSLTGTSYWQ